MPVDTRRCANCGIELDESAVERDAPPRVAERDRPRYCCDGCADGGPCVC